MSSTNARGLANHFHGVMTLLVIAPLLFGNSLGLAQQTETRSAPPAPVAADSAAAPAEAAPKIPNDQLDSLVSPIALYPDPLLSQTLVASTYPLEIIQLQQWLAKNKSLKGAALTTALEQQKWDPSIQSMAALPDVVKQLADNVSWTTDLGNAFLAQQADVMAAVQRMRAKAQSAGNLKTSQQQKVETKTVESKTVIVIEQADPKIVYVPTYNPTVVYGVAVYPYPPIVYPPGYGMLAFGAGVAIGAAWGNGGWGYGCGWGGSNNDITINNNNNYVNHYNKNNNINNGNRPNGGQGNGSGNKWQHSAQHRGGAPYGDRGTANKYGGNARQQPAGGNRSGSSAGAGNRPGSGAGAGNMGAGNRPGGGAGAATRPSGGGSGLGGGGGGGRASTMPSGGGANKIGNQNLGGGGSSSGGGSRGGGGNSPSFSSSSRGGGGGFGGGGGGSARASSSRGGSSMGGGGFSHGGGGGGGRGGGGGGGRRR